jgi:translation initiation factor 2B subunit (eIF-2B alpha/beta/delta family)
LSREQKKVLNLIGQIIIISLGLELMDAPELEKTISEIANDRTSGASFLAKSAVECLDQFAGWVCDTMDDLSPKDYLLELMEVGNKLVQTQPTMASIFRAVNDVIITTKEKTRDIENEVGTDLKTQIKYLCTFTQSCARKYILESDLALETISRAYSEILHAGESVMTISASSAVERLLTQANNDSMDLTVYVPESRPMYEGRIMAERLAEKGINVILIADSAMFHYLSDCSTILVGADRVVPEGMVNKIGTYGLAMASQELKKTFYCVCELMKFIPNIVTLEKLIVTHPSNLLLETCDRQKKSDNLTVKNIYFDFTPMEYITKFLTEDGLKTPNQVREYINTVEILPELVADFK